MPDNRLPIIAKPAEGTRTVLQLAAGSLITVVNATANSEGTNLLCGQCEKVLVKVVKRPGKGRLSNVVLGCPCGSYNELKKAP